MVLTERTSVDDNFSIEGCLFGLNEAIVGVCVHKKRYPKERMFPVSSRRTPDVVDLESEFRTKSPERTRSAARPVLESHTDVILDKIREEDFEPLIALIQQRSWMMANRPEGISQSRLRRDSRLIARKMVNYSIEAGERDLYQAIRYSSEIVGVAGSFSSELVGYIGFDVIGSSYLTINPGMKMLGATPGDLKLVVYISEKHQGIGLFDPAFRSSVNRSRLILGKKGIYASTYASNAVAIKKFSSLSGDSGVGFNGLVSFKLD